MDKLFNFTDLEINNILFGDVYQTRHNHIIPIGVQAEENEEEEVSPLLLNTPSNLYSNGVQEIRDKDDRLVGYNMKLNLWNKNPGPTVEEKKFTVLLNDILNHTKEYLSSLDDDSVSNHIQNNLDNLKLISWRDDEKTKNKYPHLYMKLMINTRNKKILSSFFDEEAGEIMDSNTLLRKNGLFTSAIKIEAITINPKRISFEVKLIETLWNKIKSNRHHETPPSLLRPGQKFKKKSQKVVRNNEVETTKNVDHPKNIYENLKLEEDDEEQEQVDMELGKMQEVLDGESEDVNTLTASFNELLSKKEEDVEGTNVVVNDILLQPNIIV
jgi:hypothetical protein